MKYKYFFGISILLIVGFSPVNTEAADNKPAFIIGVTTSLKSFFCDKDKQLVELYDEYQKNGFEAARKLQKTMKTPWGYSCGSARFLVTILEVPPQRYLFKGVNGFIVRGSVSISPFLSIDQWFWTSYPIFNSLIEYQESKNRI